MNMNELMSEPLNTLNTLKKMKKRGWVMKGCEELTAEAAENCKKRAGNHFMAGGEELRKIFDRVFCDRCLCNRNDNICLVRLDAHRLPVQHMEYPWEWVYGRTASRSVRNL